MSTAGIAVYALECDASLPGLRSRHPRQVFALADWRAEVLYDTLVEVRHALAAHDRVSLIAVSDRQVAALAQYLSRLRPLYALSWADAVDEVLHLQRKDGLAQHCARRGMLYPATQLVLAPSALPAAAGLGFPVIAKPVVPLSGFKTLLAHDVASLEDQLAPHTASFPVLVQEYVPGDDRQIFFAALMLDRGRLVASVCGRKLASHPPARGQTTAAETVDMPEIAALARRFFAGSRLSGPVSLELKRGPDGRFWVIEPTVGRSDFWAGLCIRAGFNQPLLEHLLACGLPLPTPPRWRPAQWFDSERDPLALLKYGWRAGDRLASGHSFSYADWHDPGPMLAAFPRLLARLFRRRV